MAENPGKSPLDGLEDRLQRARKTQEEKKPKNSETGRAMGVAFRISFELVLGVFIGAAIGWYLDKWLGTLPLFLIIFFILGFAAGLRNVFRAAARLGGKDSDAETNETEE